jgi:hypothetical protein
MLPSWKANPSGPLERFPITLSSTTDKGSARKIYSMCSKRTLCTKRLSTVDDHAIDKPLDTTPRWVTVKACHSLSPFCYSTYAPPI